MTRTWHAVPIAVVGMALLISMSGCSISIETAPDGPPGGPSVGTALGQWRLVRVAGSLGLESGEGQFRVVWPPRFTAEERDGSAVLLDASRKVVALEGQLLAISGQHGEGRLVVCEIDGVLYC